MTCDVRCSLFAVSCGLPQGHEGPHVHENDQERIEWEPREQSRLRREVERLRRIHEAEPC